MDPNACWARVEVARQAKDYEELGDAAADLTKWLDRGGALPKALADLDMSRDLARRVCRTIRDLADQKAEDQTKGVSC